MQKICLIASLQQPIYLSRNFPYERAKRIAEEASLMDRYFDLGLCHKLYQQNTSQIFTPMLTGLLEVAEATAKTPNPFRFAVSASGLFMEQVMKWDAFLLSVIKKLLGLGALEFVSTPYYNSLASLYSGGMDEFEEQVKEDASLLAKMFAVQPKILANTKLLFNDKIARSAEAMGYAGIFVDGVRGLNVENPSLTYTSTAAPDLRLLVRNTKVSVALVNGAVEEVEKLKEGDGLGVIYLDSDELGRRDKTYFKLIAGTLHEQGFSFATPSECVRDTTPSGSLSVPEPLTIATEESGGSVNLFLANPMQRISYDRVSALRPFIKEAGVEQIKSPWRILQQLDQFVCMGDHLPPAYHRIFSSPAETFSVYNTILVDFEGKVTSHVQRMRKSRSPAAPRPAAPPVGYRTPAQMLDRDSPSSSSTAASMPHDKRAPDF